MTSVRSKLGKSYVTAEPPPWRATLGATLTRAMTLRQPVTWKLLLTHMRAWKVATRQCARLTKGPKTWPSTHWVAYSLWTTSCSLKVERSSLSGPTMLDPERSFPRRCWRISVPLRARRTYKFARRSVVLTCWLVSSVPLPPCDNNSLQHLQWSPWLQKGFSLKKRLWSFVAQRKVV